MTPLKENEWILINETLLELYSIENIKSLRKKFLELIRMLVPYSQASFIVVDEKTGKILLEDSVTIDMDEKFMEKYNELYYKLDYASYGYNYSKSITYKDSNFLEEPIRKKTQFYQEFLLPEKLPFVGGLILMKNHKLLGLVNLFRAEYFGDFKDKDLYILDKFKDHLVNILFKLGKNSYNISVEKLKIMEEYNLSKREIEIVEFIINGFSNNEISNELAISISTVKKHINNIFNKLDVNSRTQLIKLFMGY